MAYSQIAPGRRAHTVAFLVDGRDYFSARLDNGGVRVGLVGGTCYDVPAGHAYFDRIVAAETESTVETIHDELTSTH